MPPGAGRDFSSPISYQPCRCGHPLLSRAGWRWDLQKCLPVAVLQETLTFCLRSTSPGWVSPTVQVKVHPLSLRHCCLPQPCLLSRCIIRRQHRQPTWKPHLNRGVLSFQQSSCWEVENKELLLGTQLHFPSRSCWASVAAGIRMASAFSCWEC